MANPIETLSTDIVHMLEKHASLVTTVEEVLEHVQNPFYTLGTYDGEVTPEIEDYLTDLQTLRQHVESVRMIEDTQNAVVSDSRPKLNPPPRRTAVPSAVEAAQVSDVAYVPDDPEPEPAPVPEAPARAQAPASPEDEVPVSPDDPVQLLPGRLRILLHRLEHVPIMQHHFDVPEAISFWGPVKLDLQEVAVARIIAPLMRLAGLTRVSIQPHVVDFRTMERAPVAADDAEGHVAWLRSVMYSWPVMPVDYLPADMQAAREGKADSQ